MARYCSSKAIRTKKNAVVTEGAKGLTRDVVCLVWFVLCLRLFCPGGVDRSLSLQTCVPATIWLAIRMACRLNPVLDLAGASADLQSTSKRLSDNWQTAEARFGHILVIERQSSTAPMRGLLRLY